MSEFQIKRDNPSIGRQITNTEVFTFWGDHDIENQQGFPVLSFKKNQDVFKIKNAYAIKMSSENKTLYYVKRGKHGQLYNPIGLYSTKKGSITVKDGVPEWRFQKTSEKIFNYYINFLKTKNIAWLNNAEREV